MNGKQRTALLAVLALAIIAVLGGMLYQKHAAIEQYQAQIQAAQSHALAELADNLDHIEIALQKWRYATSPPLITALGTELYARATAARMALGSLPYDFGGLDEVRAFLAQVGDYAHTRTRTAYEVDDLITEDHTRLTALADTAAALTREFKGLRTEAPAVPAMAGITSANGTDPEISRKEARGIAADFFDLKGELFSYTGVKETPIPAYIFVARVDGGDFKVAVSQAGGQVISASSGRAVRRAPLTGLEGKKVAMEFLTDNGFDTMEVSRWRILDNQITVTFIHVEDHILHYPDAIQVSVALDNGRITGFSALDYLQNHRTRDQMTSKINADQAREAVSDDLSVLAHSLALIQIGDAELLSYEFKCIAEDGQRVLVYVSAATGRQLELFLLIEDESGRYVR
ncbi:MAG: germination protein YpeB [Oscillospiraceae bacterium]|nr:germination protein YpeB [Oscillospiraceae bacterium]